MATFAAIAAISTIARRRRYADMVSTTPRRWLHFWRKARRKKPRAAKRIRMALHEVQRRNLTGGGPRAERAAQVHPTMLMPRDGKLGLVGGLGPDQAKHYILRHHMIATRGLNE